MSLIPPIMEAAWQHVFATNELCVQLFLKSQGFSDIMSLLLHDQGRPIGPQTTPGQVAEGPGPLVCTGQWHAPDVERQVLAVDNALHTASWPSRSGHLAPLPHAANVNAQCQDGSEKCTASECRISWKVMHDMSACVAQVPQLLHYTASCPRSKTCDVFCNDTMR